MTQTPNFDFKKAIEELDKSNMIGSIEQLGDQVQHVWEQAQEVKFDDRYQNIDKIVVAGMGGSALGARVIRSVFKDELEVPLTICGDYKLPNYVDKNTLVIASSYSGTTEETLSAMQDAIKKGAKITGITSGGELGPLLKEKGYPGLVFEAKYNPSDQPRMALGYSIFGQISLLNQIGLLKITEEDYQQVLETIAKLQMEISRHIPKEENPAKLLAFNFLDRLPIITISEHLEGPAHVVANQINENSKNYSEFRVVPELNHHLMEGLQFPTGNDNNLVFLTIHSDLYLPGNEKRMSLTEQVIDKNNIPYLSHKLSAPSKISQAFKLILLGSYVGFYLAILNNVNPSPIPWVDWFKEELAKS